MAKKYYGRIFNADTVKALKASERIICQKINDAEIYVCNNFFGFRCTLPEYNEIVRPIAQRDPGNWTICNGEFSESRMDIKKLIEKAVSDTPRKNLLQSAPFLFQNGKGQIKPFYCKAADFVIFFDVSLVSALDCTIVGTGPVNMAVAYDGDDPVGVLLPIRHNPEWLPAVRAYFNTNGAPVREKPETDPAELDALKMENKRLRADLSELQRRLNETREKDPAAPDNAAIIAGLQKELADEKARADSLVDACSVLREKLAAAEKAGPAPKAEKTDVHAEAEKIRAYWDAFDGIRAAIAGVKTSAPVVWLDGPQVNAKKDDIRKAGGLYSGKRRAWYFSIR